MKYGSVCSGIEAASVAWHPLGWEAQWFSEIEAFPSAVLAHRFPNVPNLGDMTKLHENETFRQSTIDVLVGGTPCQSFSVAGLRKGLDDPRGNLMLTFLNLAGRKRPTWVVWENVPGVLSSNEGRDFGTFLSGLAELGYGFAYRVLDAQYFGVAQRRRRVFVVGHLGDWRPAAAVLFERHSLSGHPAPRREKREGAASRSQVGTITRSWGNGLGHNSQDDMAIIHPIAVDLYNQSINHETNQTLSSAASDVNHTEAVIVPHVMTLGHTQSNGLGITQTETANTLEASSSVNQAVAFGVGERPDVAHCLRSGASKADKHESTTYVAQPIPINTMTMLGRPSDDLNPRMSSGIGNPGDPQNTLTKAHSHAVAHGTAIRRLTPIETERLQGFPIGWTRIPYRNKPADQCPDGPRYKACGNSMAVPVMRWIGERIQMVNDIL